LPGKGVSNDVVVAFGNVMVTAPTTDELRAEGLVDDDDSAFVIVEIVDDLAGMVDANTSGGSQSDWAAAVEALQPTSKLAGAPYVLISIIAGNSVADMVEISDLGSLEVNLFIAGTDFPQDDLDRVQLYSYDS